MYFESIWQVFVWPVCSVSCTADICRSNGQVSSEYAHDIVNSAAQNGGMGGRERDRHTDRQRETETERQRHTERHSHTERIRKMSLILPKDPKTDMIDSKAAVK